MNSASRDDLVKRLLDHIRSSTTDLADQEMIFDSSLYSDGEVLEREIRAAFKPAFLPFAHRDELSKRGNYVARTLLGAPLVAVRQDDGSVKVFRNVCRHRNAPVVGEAQGRCRAMTCGYHGWTYQLDGSLRSVPHGREGFPAVAAATHSLIEVPSEERYGVVWVNLASDGSVHDFLGVNLVEELHDHHLEDFHLFRHVRFEREANWKLIADGFLEVYHVRFLHPQTLAPTAFGNILAFDKVGKHFRTANPKKSMTAMLEDDTYEGDPLEHVILSYYLVPGTVIGYFSNQVHVFSITPHPSDPGRCVIDLWFLTADADRSERSVKHWEKNLDFAMRGVEDEDWVMADKISAGLSQAEPGRTVTIGRNEIGVQALHRRLQEATETAKAKGGSGSED